MDNPDSVLQVLSTVRDYIRWGASRFNEHGLAFGHGTDNAVDEAAILVMHALHLQTDMPTAYLDATLTLEERHAVVDLLRTPLVSRRFALSEADGELIREWVEDLAIRWGRDGQQKGELGLPAYDENTWQAGLDRLLLGYAMADRNALFAGILPFGPMEGSEADLLGRLLDAVEALFAWLSRLPGKRRLAEWGEMLQAASWWWPPTAALTRYAPAGSSSNEYPPWLSVTVVLTCARVPCIRRFTPRYMSA